MSLETNNPSPQEKEKMAIISQAQILTGSVS